MSLHPPRPFCSFLASCPGKGIIPPGSISARFMEKRKTNCLGPHRNDLAFYCMLHDVRTSFVS
jgi:hypothetical protein